jgi:hypothetical protein
METNNTDAAEGWKILKQAERVDTAVWIKNYVYVFIDEWYFVYTTPNQWSRRTGLMPRKIDKIVNLFPAKISLSGQSLYNEDSAIYCISTDGSYESVTLGFDEHGLISNGIFAKTAGPAGYVATPKDAALGYYKITSSFGKNDPAFEIYKGSAVLFKDDECLFTSQPEKLYKIAGAFKIPAPFSNKIDAALTVTETTGLHENPLEFKRLFLFSGRYQAVMTNEITGSELDMAFWVPETSISSPQTQWYECTNCQSLGDPNNGKDNCSTGGDHDFKGKPLFVQVNDAYSDGDIYWKRCERCHLLARPGKCAGGGYHIFSNHANYNLLPAQPTAEKAYTMCAKCGVMVNFNIPTGTCAGGGNHQKVSWGHYQVNDIESSNWKYILHGKLKEPFTAFKNGQAVAFDFINQQFGELYPNPGNIRACYLPDSVTVTADVLEFIDQIVKKPDAVLQSDWDAVLKQLRLETGKVNNLQNFFRNIRLKLLTVTVLDKNDLDTMLAMLEAEIDPKDPPEINIFSFLLGVFTALLGGIPGLGEVTKEAVEFTRMVVELVNESITLGRELNEQEETPGEDRFLLNAARLQADLNDRFIKLQQFVTASQTTIMSDWGSLQAAHEILMNQKGADLIFSNVELMEKGYRLQALRTLLPIKFGILILHQNDFAYGGFIRHNSSAAEALKAVNSVILGEELSHAVSVLPHFGACLFVNRAAFKKNELLFDFQPAEAFIQYFASRGIMEWLTEKGDKNFGINKDALIQGLMGWEGIECRKAIVTENGDRWNSNRFMLQYGAHYLSNGMPYDPVEDLSSWRPN